MISPAALAALAALLLTACAPAIDEDMTGDPTEDPGACTLFSLDVDDNTVPGDFVVCACNGREHWSGEWDETETAPCP